MHRAVTAIYRNYAAAQQVRDAIEATGVSASYIDIIPDADDRLEAGATRSDDVLDDLHDLNLPEDDIRTYQQAVRRGDFVVSANVDEDEVAAVVEAMRQPEEHMYDIDATEEEFRSADYVAPVTGALGAMGGGIAATAERAGDAMGGATEAVADGTEGVLREAEERLRVGKRDVEGGSVHVRSYVHEVPVEERIRLRQERVEVRRLNTGEEVLTGADADAVFQERSIDVTEHNEEAVVSKETVVTGKVAVSKDAETEERVISDTVRKTEVEVDDDTVGTTGFNRDRDRT